MSGKEHTAKYSSGGKRPLRGIIRTAIRPERRQLLEHLLRLTVDDRGRRFCGTVSDDFISRYCLVDDEYERIVVGYWNDGVMRGAGEVVLPLTDCKTSFAEIALSVEAEFQGQGVGTALFRKLLTVAGKRGVAMVRVVSQRDNRRLRALAFKFDATFSTRMDGELEMFITPPAATRIRRMRELSEDGEAVRSDADLRFGT